MRLSRSRPAAASKLRVSFGAGVKTSRDEAKKERRKGSRRLRHRFDNLVESDEDHGDNVDDTFAKNVLQKPATTAKVRVRSREGVLKRRKGLKKSKINMLSREEESEEKGETDSSSEIFKQRRVRGRLGQKEEITLNVSKPQQLQEAMTKSEFANRLQRRLRPRKKVHQEVKRKDGESEHSSRFRTANKDPRSRITAQTPNKESLSTQIPAETAAPLVHQTIETLSIDPSSPNAEHRNRQTFVDLATKRSQLTSQAEIMETTQKNEVITTRTTADTNVEMAEASVMPPPEGLENEDDNELFLPTIRSQAQTKKSRKRLRKVINDTPRESDDDSDDKSDWVANSIKSRRGQGRPGARYSPASHSSVDNDIREGGRRRSRLRSRPRPFRPIFISESTTKRPTTTSTTTTTTTSTTTEATTTTTRTTTTASTTTTKTSTVSSEFVDFDLTTERFENPFRSRGGRPIEKTTTVKSMTTQHKIESSPVVLTPLFDLEKALEHAEKTWAQDPFRRITGLPGKPVFDIDYTKNPATSYNELVSPLYDLRSNGRNKKKSVNYGRTSLITNDPQVSPSSRETLRASSNTELFDVRKSIESFLWTPALLKDPAQ